MATKEQRRKDLLKKIKKTVRGRNRKSIEKFTSGLLKLYTDAADAVYAKLIKHLRRENWYSAARQKELLKSIDKEILYYTAKAQRQIK